MKQTNGKMKKNSSKSVKITLNKKDAFLLDRYAKLNSLTDKTAAKKIIKEFLAANVTMPEQVAENQLDLFACRETDLFDYTK